jgi:molecular chaperone DnaK
VKDAEANSAEDKKKVALVEAKNQAEGLIHATNKSLLDLGDKVSPQDKEGAETAIAEVKEAIEAGDPDVIKEKTTALQQAAMKIGEALYKQSSGASKDGGRDDDDDKDDGPVERDELDDIMDAEFEEVKDDDKKK